MIFWGESCELTFRTNYMNVNATIVEKSCQWIDECLLLGWSLDSERLLITG